MLWVPSDLLVDDTFAKYLEKYHCLGTAVSYPFLLQNENVVADPVIGTFLLRLDSLRPSLVSQVSISSMRYICKHIIVRNYRKTQKFDCSTLAKFRGFQMPLSIRSQWIYPENPALTHKCMSHTFNLICHDMIWYNVYKRTVKPICSFFSVFWSRCSGIQIWHWCQYNSFILKITENGTNDYDTVEAELHVSDFHPVKQQPAPVLPDHTTTTKNNSNVKSNITVSTEPYPLTKSITTIGSNSSAQVNITVETTEAPTTTGSQFGQYSSTYFAQLV